MLEDVVEGTNVVCCAGFPGASARMCVLGLGMWKVYDRNFLNGVR